MAKRRIPNTMKPADRQAVMTQLRRDGVNDTIIGRAFGVSRERVGQLIGRNRATAIYQKKNNEKNRTLLAMAKDGKSAKEIAESIEVTQSRVFQALKDLGHYYSDFHEQRSERKRARLMDDVLRFATNHNVNFTIPNLIRHDETLWRKMARLGHIGEWRNEIRKEIEKRGLDLKIREPYSKP